MEAEDMHPALQLALRRIEIAVARVPLLPGAAVATDVDAIFEETTRLRRELIADRALRSADSRALSSALLHYARTVELDLRSRRGPLGWLERTRVRRHLLDGLRRWRAERVATVTYPYGRFLRGRVA